MNTQITIALAQLNMLVGDICANTQRVIDESISARDQQNANVIIFPELTLTGYPPEDLLLRPVLPMRIEQALEKIKHQVQNIYVVLGYPKFIHNSTKQSLYNAAGVIYNGRLIAEYAKQRLPNYAVFDEKRYFLPGNDAVVVNINGIPVGLTICEDVWDEVPVKQAKEAGAKLIFNLNASPFHIDKLQVRQALLERRTQESNIPIIYVNQVGGQDELVFDGGSMVMDASSKLQVLMPAFKESVFCTSVKYCDDNCTFNKENRYLSDELTLEASVYQALVLGVQDYVNKNGFPGVVLGLSGGIDSALTLAIAVDALGKDRVEAVMMPFHYTAKISQEDAKQQSEIVGVRYHLYPIESMYDAFIQILQPAFQNTTVDTTEENIQARCRGIILMALSNKHNYLVLTTGNKSELAVGYATLYGDMAGGFDVLKDVPKTLVYRLAKYRNSISSVIPQRVIDREPSAELAPNQQDSDSLPPYGVLDSVLALYIEQDLGAEQIIKQGFDPVMVKKVIRLVDANEYKRRQSPIGVRITQRGFGRDRRYPVTSGWSIDNE